MWLPELMWFRHFITAGVEMFNLCVLGWSGQWHLNKFMGQWNGCWPTSMKRLFLSVLKWTLNNVFDVDSSASALFLDHRSGVFNHLILVGRINMFWWKSGILLFASVMKKSQYTDSKTLAHYRISLLKHRKIIVLKLFNFSCCIAYVKLLFWNLHWTNRKFTDSFDDELSLNHSSITKCQTFVGNWFSNINIICFSFHFTPMSIEYLKKVVFQEKWKFRTI